MILQKKLVVSMRSDDSGVLRLGFATAALRRNPYASRLAHISAWRAVFIHILVSLVGCPKHSNIPASNRAFWMKKLTGNQARDRLATRHFTAAVSQAHIFDPEGACAAGFLDELAAPEELLDAGIAQARRLAALPHPAWRPGLRHELRYPGGGA